MSIHRRLFDGFPVVERARAFAGNKTSERLGTICDRKASRDCSDGHKQRWRQNLIAFRLSDEEIICIMLGFLC